MAKTILTGLIALILVGCGGSGNDSFTFAGRWVGYSYSLGAQPVDVQSDKSGQFTGTKNGNPVTGYFGTETVVFSDGDHPRYRIENGRIEGLHISLGKQ